MSNLFVEALENPRVERQGGAVPEKNQQLVFLTGHFNISWLARGPLAARRALPWIGGPQVKNP